ncbi:MAG: type II toxin-antitoxin system RelE/ParE family toxin [Acidobacteriia bacterium]|nr:type II toxin-antitoxin system RelE/ParE family toxin [Terriglobia bacterium]
MEALIAWSAERYPGLTENFATGLLDHLELLRGFPRLGAPLRRRPAIRRLLHTPFYVYYRLDEEKRRIEILRMWHVARKHRRRLTDNSFAHRVEDQLGDAMQIQLL